MRRDIQEVRLDAGSLRASQSAIKDDTARLKAVIDLVKTESGRLKAQLDQLMSLVNKLQSNVRSYCALHLYLIWTDPRSRRGLYSALTLTLALLALHTPQIFVHIFAK